MVATRVMKHAAGQDCVSGGEARDAANCGSKHDSIWTRAAGISAASAIISGEQGVCEATFRWLK